jgi:cellulose synthase/poly-beta-1,6-N-acetylglucosamine synthase-like glycosyltransferase
MKVSIVIPVYNERAFIEEVSVRVLAVPIDKEIIVVDHRTVHACCLRNSTRRSRKARATSSYKTARRASRSVISFSCFIPRIVERVLLCAVAVGDVVLVQDADLKYDPKDYPALLEPILDGRADVVYGSRFMGSPQRVHYF